MPAPVDLVYVLGSGSQWNNNELRISLRSVERNLKNFGKIFVVGEDPGFLSSNVIYIYYPDEISTRNADGNMARKIIRACADPRLSDNFLFMNDDFIINKEIDAAEIPWMHKGDMKDRPPKFWKSQFYRYRLRRTFDVLSERNLPTLQYDYHAPMLMNKKKFPQVMAKFDYAADIGYTFRSLYGNSLKLKAEPLVDQKITMYESYTLAQIKARVALPVFVGYNDLGLNNSFKYWMVTTFHEQSRFEKNNYFNDRISDIAQWQLNGMDYHTGVAIFLRYHKAKNVSRILADNRTIALETKLKFKLTQYLLNL